MLYLYKRIIFGLITNDKLNNILDLNFREKVILVPLALVVLLIGIFPNLFIMNTSQGGFTANFPHLLDESAVHQAFIMSHALASGIESVEVTKKAED